MARNTSKSSGEVIDLHNLPEGGGSKFRVPEGDYPFKVKSVKLETSSKGNKMFTWEFVGTGGKVRGKVLKEYTSLAANALWKLRDVIEAVTDGKLPKASDAKSVLQYCKKLIGKEVGITLVDDEYTNDKGKSTISSKASDFLTIDDLESDGPDDDDDVEDDEDVEDEEDSDDEEEEEDEDDGLDELDRAELKAHIKENKLDVRVKKSMSDDDIRAAIREGDDDEEIEDVDLDEL